MGSLYPALCRLEARKWVRARWGLSENNRRARYYELTPAGRKQLEIQAGEWAMLSATITTMLRVTSAGA
jgi:DNA-binding PadR family transcriptional regulator